MPRQRTDISHLELMGAKNNIWRAKRRERNALPLTPQTEKEVAQLDKLIAMAMRDCRRGPVIGRAEKRNPSFENLRILIRARAILLKDRKPAKKLVDAKSESFDAFLTVPTQEQSE